jgi:cellobiose-specific phosphotransferase system component IIB
MRTYYRTQMNPNSIQSQIQRGRRPQAVERPVAWSAETVWAAAAYAYRINGAEYLKDPEYAKDDQGLWTDQILRLRNRDVMKRALDDHSMITAEDRDLGHRARDWLSKTMMVKALKGSALSEFEQGLQQAVSLTELDEWGCRYELALVASQIRAYEQAVQLEAAMAGISAEPIADIGAKVDVEITVVKSVYSQNFGVFFITGITTDRRAVFFSYRDRLANGHQCRIRGTVKAHRENSTQLNRVRMV